MSKWSHVCAVFVVNTFSPIAITKVERFLLTAPQITGREGYAQIFLNQPEGFNHYDIDKEFQSEVVITIYGNLRDKSVRKTRSEVKDFIAALNEKFYVRCSSVKIY